MSIPSHIIDQINSQADLVSIIGKHTTLKKAGNEYKGCCPFHGEKTPSFYVNPQKNLYHCFGCGVSGNAVSFLKDYENLTFVEAITELSKQTGIEIPKDNNPNVNYRRTPRQSSSNHQQRYTNHEQQNSSTSPHQQPLNNQSSHNNHNNFINSDEVDLNNNQQIDTHHSSDIPPDMSMYQNFDTNMPNLAEFSDQYIQTPPQGFDVYQEQDGNLYDLLQRIQQFYTQCLTNNPQAKNYFIGRGLTQDTVDTFGLGYAPAGWQHLEQQFPQDIEGLSILGLIRTSDSGRSYNLLRDRVIFSIKDNQGRIIGFAGRALDNDVKPKYINSSDSPVFHKQHILYGYYESRQHRANDWLVVEGYMDVIALYQAGIYGAVASMGTATNASQISRLLTLNPKLTLSFDGDAAGQKAAWRTLEVSLPILSDDKELRFLTLPDNHDPDTYISAYGKESMLKQIDDATPLSQYVFNYLSNLYDLNLAEGKAKLMSQVRSLTSQLPKGSSFKYLLNNDIYQKLGGKKNYQKVSNDHLLDFNSELTLSLYLSLCLLYQPKLLANKPIQNIWQESGIVNEKISDSTLQRLDEAAINKLKLLTWQDLNDELLLELTSNINQLIAVLPEDTNIASHYILASLSEAFQKNLVKHWHKFFHSMIDRNILDIEPLFKELLTRLLSNILKQQIETTNNYFEQAVYRQRWQTLTNWKKQLNAAQV